RMIQTNLRETDMADIDAERYVSELKRFSATVVLINAAGIIASYPTKLKYHYQSPFLTGDSLETLIRTCRREGIRVLARTDFSKIRREVYEAHPEWAYRTATGDIVDFEGDVHACVNGGYQREYALEIIRECITTLDFDGIFFNMGGYQVRDYAYKYHGICHCEACRTLFRERYGKELPLKADMGDPVYRAYRRFQHETTEEHNERVCRFIRELRPEMLVNRDVYTLDTGMIRQESNTALDRPLPHWQYSGSENTKWSRASFPGYISSNTSVDFLDFPIRHVAVSPVQQETRLWQNLANAGQLDYYLIGRLDNHDDTSGYAGVERVFRFHEKNAALYRDNHSITRTAMVTPDHWGGFGSDTEAAGLYRMLSEGHHLFDVVFLSRIRHIDLGKYDILILPDLAEIGDEEARILDGFVAAGGRMLCTGRTGSRDGGGEERKAHALACAGMRGRGLPQDARGAYFRLDDAERGVFTRFDGVRLVAIDGDYVYASYDDDAERLLRMVPPQPFGPPERCYPRFPAGENPGAVLMRYGAGVCLTVPWFPGRLFHRQGYPNTMMFVLDLLENRLGVRPVRTDLPPMAEVTLTRTAVPGTTLLHVVNQTGHFGNSFYPPVTLPSAFCAVPMPECPASAESLMTGRPVPFEWADGELTVHLTGIGLCEAVLIRT
ncbi:MAG: hypothetical protein KBA30_09270, partial [Clostridia bacterium]|nr:hypothetical protein [Clostridia bacterium]